ncbi:MAG TPA: metallophosphoesterase [bacterium]|jgi:putative phosphoesterase|nr:metallophosphoesterase [bacterium]
MKRKELRLILGSAVGALICLFVASPIVSHQFAAFRFSIKILPGLGYTRFELPPIGLVEAKTHISPLSIVLSLQSINLDKLQQLLAIGGSKEILIATWAGIKWKLVGRLLLWALFIAVVGGIWGSSWVSRRWHDLIKGGLTGVVLVLILVFVTVSSYNYQALASPTYKGALAGVPWVIGLARNAWNNWSVLGDTARLFVRNLNQVMATSQAPLQHIDRHFKILHVSDLHNNPQAIDFILEICTTLTPDIIIDTGDLTDFGTPLEETFYSGLSRIKTPYYVVLGNHDSPSIAEKITYITGVTILDGFISVDNIQIMGSRDPASWTNTLVPSSAEQILNQEGIIRGWLRMASTPPFLLAVHDPRTARLFSGEIPVILAGHTHVSKIEKSNGTITINAGTTGGAGLRGLMVEKEVPLTAALLYVDTEGASPILAAVDLIRLYPREKRFELTRSMVSLDSNLDQDIL